MKVHLTSKQCLIVITLLCLSSLTLSKQNRHPTTDYDSPFNHRQLYTEQQFLKICADGNFTLGIDTSYFSNISNTISNTINSNTTANAQKLIDFIKSGSSQDLMDYVWTRATPYIVFIAFAVITIIVAIFEWICCCCPYWFCRKTESDSKCCRCLSVILLFVLSGGVIIACILGFIYSAQFMQGNSNVTCAFITFYRDIVDGENKTTIPKWAGINGIVQSLQSSVTAIDKIVASSATAFNNMDWTKTASDDFKNELDNYYSSYSTSTLSSPHPVRSSTQVTPSYISNLGPQTKSGTTLYSFNAEFQSVITGSVEVINQIKKNTDQITTNSNSVKKEINNIVSDISPMQTTFKDLQTNVIDTWVNAQEQANTQGVVGFLVIFAVISGLTLINILSIIFYTMCKVQCLRLLSHFIWNLLILLTVLTFILGGIFGLAGLVGQDGPSVIQYLFSPQNLKVDRKVITDKQTADIIDVCINQDGDLSKTLFNTNSTDAKYLDQLYVLSVQLKTTQDQVSTNKNSLSVNASSILYNNMINDIGTDTSSSQDSPKYALSDFQGYTDISTNKYQSSCSGGSKDLWVHSKNSCGTYTYIGSTDPSFRVGDQVCLVIPEWTTSSASSRYGKACSVTGGSYTSVSSAATAFLSSLTTYISQNRDLLGKLLSENTKVNNIFASAATSLNQNLQNVNGVIDPLIAIFKQYVGGGSLFSITNCKFMDSDLKVVYDGFQSKFAPASFSLAAAVIAVSFLNLINIFLTLFIINKYRRSKDIVDNIKMDK